MKAWAVFDKNGIIQTCSIDLEVDDSKQLFLDEVFEATSEIMSDKEFKEKGFSVRPIEITEIKEAK